MTKDDILKIAKSKLIANQYFIALRDTEYSETSFLSFYKKETARHGDFEYNSIRDVLYSIGYGRFVVYEKGRWFDDNQEINYEIY